jgi:hypothetical protein
MTDEQIKLLTKLQGVFKDKGLVDHNIIDGEVLIIPLAIDPINPERGLVEMLDRYHSLDYYFNNCWKLSCETKNGKPINVEAPDPYTALLKALCEQENIK